MEGIKTKLSYLLASVKPLIKVDVPVTKQSIIISRSPVLASNKKCSNTWFFWPQLLAVWDVTSSLMAHKHLCIGICVVSKKQEINFNSIYQLLCYFPRPVLSPKGSFFAKICRSFVLVLPNPIGDFLLVHDCSCFAARQ